MNRAPVMSSLSNKEAAADMLIGSSLKPKISVNV